MPGAGRAEDQREGQRRSPEKVEQEQRREENRVKYQQEWDENRMGEKYQRELLLDLRNGESFYVIRQRALEDIEKKYPKNIEQQGVFSDLLTGVYREAMKGPLRNNRGDLYSRLTLKKGASVEEVKKNFRALSLVFHPDKAGKDSEDIFKACAEAYEVLGDVDKRAAYDRGAVGEGGHSRDSERKDDVEGAYEERKAKFDQMFYGWINDQGDGGLFNDTLQRLKAGMIYIEAELAAFREFNQAFDRYRLADSDRTAYIARIQKITERAKVAYEKEEKERPINKLFDKNNPEGFYQKALFYLRQGYNFSVTSQLVNVLFDRVFEDDVSLRRRKDLYRMQLDAVLKTAMHVYEIEQQDDERARREAEEKNIENFTKNIDKWLESAPEKITSGSIFIIYWRELNRGVSFKDVSDSIQKELARRFLQYNIPVTHQEHFKQRVAAALFELRRRYQKHSESQKRSESQELRRVQFRGRADVFIQGIPGYVKTELKKIDLSKDKDTIDKDTMDFVAQLKMLCLEQLNPLIAEYPELTAAEARRYRARLEESIDNTVAAVKKEFAKERVEKRKEALNAWLNSLEEMAFQAMRGGEPYADVFERIKKEAQKKVVEFNVPLEKQGGYVGRAEDAVDKAFSRNEKEKKAEYEKWSKPWFAGLRGACETGLENGYTPEVVKGELRAMLDSKVRVLPNEGERENEIRKMNTVVDAIIKEWQNKPKRKQTPDVENWRRGEEAAPEAWLTNEAARKIREVLVSGMRKGEVETIVRAILLAKMGTLSQADRKPYFDRLATLVASEYIRYEENKKREPTEAERKRAEFEQWVHPWFSRLAGSCRTLLEGRKFVNGNWELLDRKYNPDAVTSFVKNELAEKLKLIPPGEHAMYIERADNVVAAAIALDTWKKTLPFLCYPMLAAGESFDSIRKDIEKQLAPKLVMVSADQHAAYRKGVGESLSRLEELYVENQTKKGGMNDFLLRVFADTNK